jgi:hypothetical protein
MLVALATATVCPVSAYAQYPVAVWPSPTVQQGYNLCVVPRRQLYDPWGEPLEPDVVYVSPPFDCTDFMRQLIPQTSTQQTTVADSPAVLELQEKVRKIEIRVEALEGKAN